MFVLVHGMAAFAAGLLLLGQPTGLFADGPSEPKPAYQASGTKRMAEILARWHREFGERNPYRPVARLKSLQEQLPGTQQPEQRFAIQIETAADLLILGQPEAALTVLTNLQHELRADRFTVSQRDRRDMRLQEAVANLRLGELENCIQHHNPDSCLLPIRDGGQHVERRGAQNAEAILLELARQRRNDLDIRWLLNVVAMTLGKYPDNVPAEFRIPPAVFDSEVPFPKFPEIATKIGISVNDTAGGTIVEDFDGDGLLDVMLSNWDNLGQCRLYKNLGNGRFEETTERAGLTGVTGGLNIIQADYNNDGWPDVYLIRGPWFGEMGLVPDSLLKNNGDGTFADVTEEAGLLSFHPALSAVWFDANNDGWLDLFVGNETSHRDHPHACQLFLNKRDGTFTECGQIAGVALVKFVRGVTAGDFDNDGWSDLYVSILDDTNILLRNDGKPGTQLSAGAHFTDVTERARVGEPRFSFPTWFWDYDNDGWLDIFVCGYGAGTSAYYSGNFGSVSLTEVIADKLGMPSKAEHPRLFRNNHDGTFTDVTRQAHLNRAVLAMGANYGDLDNDGWLDFYAGTGAPWYGSLLPNEMFRNKAGELFQNVTTAGGFGHLQKGHAVAFADLNNDGYQEVVINVGGAFPGDTFFDAIFANPGGSNRWLVLKLIGKQSNRSAIGARIKVVTSTAGRTREIHRVVNTGGSFGSNPLRQSIGLGMADRIQRVEVWWPASGQTNTFGTLEPNHFYELSEGDQMSRSLPLKPLKFVDATGSVVPR